MQLVQDTIETSMSALSNFQRCRKKWKYSEMYGWVPRTVPANMEIGTLYHEALAAGNRSLVYTMTGLDSSQWLAAAIAAVYGVERDRNGMPLHLDQGQREGVEDMIRYSFENFWKADIANWEEVLAIEEPAYIQIGRYLIRNTFDIVVRYRGGKVAVVDAKTTEDPRDGADWIPLDFQTRSYPLAARGKWGVAMPFRHVFIARDVPPGYGHRPITTETGKKRDKKTLERMSAPAAFIQVVETEFNDAQLDHFEQKLVRLIMEVSQAEVNQSYPETPIKMGPFACSGCPYFSTCTFEMDGNGESFQPLLYIQKGSDEWVALQNSTT